MEFWQQLAADQRASAARSARHTTLQPDQQIADEPEPRAAHQHAREPAGQRRRVARNIQTLGPTIRMTRRLSVPT